MTWREANLSLQLASEERAGTVLRMAQQRARDEQDAAFAALRAQTAGEP